MKKRMLYISNLFPNPYNPNMASFNKQSILALGEHYDIDAVVPIPWPKRLKKPASLATGATGEVTVHHPTYYYTPLVLRALYGGYFYHSISATVRELAAAKDYHLVYAAWLYPDGWAAAKVAKALKVPFFLSVLGTDVNRLGPGSLLAELSLEAIRHSVSTICVSNALKERLCELGCEHGKLTVLHNGVDRAIFSPRDKGAIRRELGLAGAEKVVLFVGNLIKEKGLHELAHAFVEMVQEERCRATWLVVIGMGNYGKKMRKMLSDNGAADRALFLGSCPLQTVARWMNACDVLCLPSYMEGQPNVVIEALSCHAKVVATNVGGIPELDDGSGNLRLVPPGTVPELKTALIEMLDREYATSHLAVKSWAAHARCLKEIFESA